MTSKVLTRITRLLAAERAAKLLPAAAIGAPLAVLLVATWGTWPDVLVDFGHELYLAWRLSAGAVLARDVAIDATGPLSPYLNALLFRAFGVGLRTLVLANVALLAALTALLYSLWTEIAGRLWATGACAFFLAVFAFGQYSPIGNYNYVTPYSHGATHGLALALAAIALRWRSARTGSLRALAAASSCLGLTVLTKPEIFLASAGAAAVDLVLRVRAAAPGRDRSRLVLAATLPALAPPALAFALLSAAAGTTVALDATFSPWLAMRSPLVRTAFYVAGLGLDDPLRNVAIAAGWFGAGLALLVPAAVLDVRAGAGRARWPAAALAAAAVAAAAWAWVPLDATTTIPRALPLAIGLGTALVLASAWRQGPRCSPATLLHAGLATFAALLLAKMALNARIVHYGFILAMPATLLVIAWLGAAVPRLVRARGGSGVPFQAVLAVALVFFAAYCLRASAFQRSRKTFAVGAGADGFVADRRGAFVNGILEGLASDGEPGATLAVLPEGVMLNYLTRRENPSPYLSYMPNAIAWKGEDALLAPLVARPPRYILIRSRDASEYGATTFGRDYAVDTWRWIRERYEPIGQVGGSPFEPTEYGMLLLRQRG